MIRRFSAGAFIALSLLGSACGTQEKSTPAPAPTLAEIKEQADRQKKEKSDQILGEFEVREFAKIDPKDTASEIEAGVVRIFRSGSITVEIKKPGEPAGAWQGRFDRTYDAGSFADLILPNIVEVTFLQTKVPGKYCVALTFYENIVKFSKRAPILCE